MTPTRQQNDCYSSGAKKNWTLTIPTDFNEPRVQGTTIIHSEMEWDGINAYLQAMLT